jgi:2-desacetyl-2-hydroxyethyl bacteriochlorophyllide A dehydrogenase
MKALVYTGPREMVYRDEADPSLAADEVVIRIDAAGICGSDMHAYHGHDPRRVPPLVLGHELAGEIVAGPGTGKRVTVNPLIACGRCEFCVQGRSNLCANRSMVGMTRPGAFADFMAIPAQSLVELPEAMSARQAALTEPAATALHALHLSMRALARPLPEADVLVIGAGAIGLLAALLLRAYGCRRLAIAEVNPLRRAAAERHSGWRGFDPREPGGPAPGSVDLVLDAVGSKETRRAALEAVKPGGVVMHVGLQDWASEIDMRKLTLAEITLLGTYTYTRADLQATVRALHDGAFGDLAWVAERRLADGARAFEDLDRGRLAAAKVLLIP